MLCFVLFSSRETHYLLLQIQDGVKHIYVCVCVERERKREVARVEKRARDWLRTVEVAVVTKGV